MTLLLRDAVVRQSSDMSTVIKGIEAALIAEGQGGSLVMPPRQNLTLDDSFLRVMPVIMGGAGVLGLKMFHGSLKRGVRYLVVLCELDKGDVLAIVDGAYLTALRTGATSALATRYLSRADASTVGVIGSGLEAETNLLATCSVRDVERAKVYSPRPQRRAAFAEAMTGRLGIEVVAVDTPEEAVGGVDIVLAATNTGPSGAIAYRGEWLERGQHVSSIGSTTPVLREIDVDTFEGSDLVVYDLPPALMEEESGDVRAYCERDPDAHRRTGVLQDLLTDAGTGTFARAAHDVTLYKSVGAALQDIACALAVYEHAHQLGIGEEVDPLAVLKTFD